MKYKDASIAENQCIQRRIRFLSVCLVFLMCFGSMTALTDSYPRNADGVENDWQYKYLEDGTVGIVGYANTDYKGILTVPEQLDGKSVTSVSGLENMKSVTAFAVASDEMPLGAYQGVLFVKKGNILLFYPLAREGSKYEMPTGVHSIGPSAFTNCGLEEIVFPDTLLMIEKNAFAGCDALTEITIPDSVTAIGDYAFSDCKGIETIHVGNGVTTIGDYAFAFCDELKTITIGNNLQSAGIAAFAGGTSLERIVIRDDHPSLYQIDGVLFSRDGQRLLLYPAGKEEEIYVVPEGTETIEAYAFSGARNIESLTISDSVRTIGDLAFTRMEQLEELRLGENVETLGNWLLWGTKSLKQLTIPAGVKKIGEAALPEGDIRVYADSYAEEYCKNNGIDYTCIEGE